ncbi:MFS transporter [bacterium SCSIO 12696]|nr:MFS transporter [bacterium SCSIO 12696]
MTAKLKIREKIGFSLGDMAGNFVYQSVLLLLAFYYTDVYGLSAATVAGIFLFVRVFDAVTDPLMGMLADRTKTRWGRYRPYLLFLCVPYATASILVFTVPDMSLNGKTIYAYVTYAVLMLLFTATNIPYFGLGSTMTADPDERVSLNSYRFAAATGGGLLITTLVIPMADWFGGDNKAVGYQQAMMVMAALSVILFLITFASTKERVKPANTGASGYKDDLKQIFKNDQWRLMALTVLIMVTAQTIKATTGIYYITYYAENAAAMVTLFLSLWMVGGIIGSSLASSVAKHICKKTAWMILCFVCAFMSAITYLIDASSLVWIMVAQFMVGFFNQMMAPMLTSIMADVTDYGELKNKRRIDGLVASFTVGILKVGLAIGGAVATGLLAVFGYQSGGVDQNADTVSGILIIFTLAPAVFFVVCGFIVRAMKLDKETVAENSRKLEELRANNY